MATEKKFATRNIVSLTFSSFPTALTGHRSRRRSYYYNGRSGIAPKGLRERNRPEEDRTKKCLRSQFDLRLTRHRRIRMPPIFFNLAKCIDIECPADHQQCLILEKNGGLNIHKELIYFAETPSARTFSYNNTIAQLIDPPSISMKTKLERRDVIVALDSCYSGNAISGSSSTTTGRAAQILAAVSVDQNAYGNLSESPRTRYRTFTAKFASKGVKGKKPCQCSRSSPNCVKKAARTDFPWFLGRKNTATLDPKNRK